MARLKSSVEIISITHDMMANERTREWTWYFRGYMQWHALADVVTELGHSEDGAFCKTAWAVIDPLLSDWDTSYKTNSGKPAWDHVNALITRARNQRQEQCEQLGISSNGQTPLNAKESSQHQYQPDHDVSAASKTEVISPEDLLSQATINGSVVDIGYENRNQTLAPALPPAPASEDPFVGNLANGAPNVPLDFENMFDAFDDSGDINFQAFDEVFMNGEWDFPGMDASFGTDLVV